jgi:hypothetical protein
MKETMYGLGSALIVSGLFLCLLPSMEIGFRSGRRRQAIAAESITRANAVLASILGLLALLLAFAFSAALQRYDDQSQAVVAEANAIGTAYLRVLLLPKGMHDEVQGLLREYLDVRIQEGRVNTADTKKREVLLQKANLMVAQPWGHAARAAEQHGRPVTSGLFIQSLNELIDAYGNQECDLKSTCTGNRAFLDVRDDRHDNSHSWLCIGNCRASGNPRGIRPHRTHRLGRLPHY